MQVPRQNLRTQRRFIQVSQLHIDKGIIFKVNKSISTSSGQFSNNFYLFFTMFGGWVGGWRGELEDSKSKHDVSVTKFSGIYIKFSYKEISYHT